MGSASDIAQDPYIHVQPDPNDPFDSSRFYIRTPEWRPNAMAHAMAQTARYRGNADEFYSVAEHSVLVASLMREVTGGDPYEGILHDAAESILPDVSAPFKQLLPDLRREEKLLDADIRRVFGLPAKKSQECTIADWLALYIEASQIVPERGLDFVDPYGLRSKAMDLREGGWYIKCLDWRAAKELWLSAFKQLAPAANSAPA
jgi:hypothetical protein